MIRFTKSFTKQAPLPQSAVDAALKVLSSADMHRYQAGASGLDEVAALEVEFAQWQGAKYCLAIASGGQAMQLAMRAIGIKHGEPVLTNSFTLAPVPGAIRAVGAEPVLVEVTENLVIDLDDLAAKAKSSGARVLMISHMRGHLADMDALMKIAEENSLTVIEDCAHTMGATWDGKKSGNFGTFACFSTQSYKHLNSGEGGFLTTDDPELMARAIIMSGSYMNYVRHAAAPDASYFEDARLDCPNMSARMDALRSCILRPQLANLETSVATWNLFHDAVAKGLQACDAILMPQAPEAAVRVGSSIQFRVPAFGPAQCLEFLAQAADRGVDLKWFGRDEPAGFTSLHKHWRYLDEKPLPETDRILSTLFDMRIPLTFEEADCHLLGEVITSVVENVLAGDSE